MRLSVFQEELASLYLRLNGYLVSGFILHAPQGGKATDRGEVDALAVRFPNNAEPEREIGPSPFLQTSTTSTDILLCEVKGGEAQLQFNDSLKANQENIKRVLRWVGAFEETQLGNDLIEKIGQALIPNTKQSSVTFPCIESPPCPKGFQIRAVMFAPDRPAPRQNQPRYVHGDELIEYVWKCLRPAKERTGCATRYNFGLCGSFEDLIRYFKESATQPTMRCLYGYFVK